MSNHAADPVKAPRASGSRLSLLSLSLLAAISAVMLSFAPAVAAIVAFLTLLYTSAAGTQSSPDAPILKARSAIHAQVTRGGGAAPVLASIGSARSEARSRNSRHATMPPSVRPRTERAVTGERVPADAGLRVGIFRGAILGDRAPPLGASSEIEFSELIPSQESHCGASPVPQDSPCMVSPAAPSARAGVAALREPDVLIGPVDRRRAASSGRLGSAPILSVEPSASGRACPQASPVTTLRNSSLRI